jgi:hypothetical protein
MSRLFLTSGPDGGLSITRIAGDDIDGSKLTKTLFELSRTSDMTTRFDAKIHTRQAVAAGISGHRALVLTAECEDTELPNDRYFRNAWEWSE